MLDFAGLIAGQLLSEVVNDVRDKVLPKPDHLQVLLGQVTEKLDKQPLGQLKSGLEYLDKGMLEQAAHILLQLDNYEPHGVMTKLAEATVLERLGEHGAAAEHMTEALMRNPFVVPAAARQLDRLLAVRPAEVLSAGDITFELRTAVDAGTGPRAALQNIQDFRHKYSVITRIAAGFSPIDGTGHVAAAWSRRAGPWSHSDRMPGPSIVSIFDLATGDLQWSRVTEDDLFAVTPRYVILRSRAKPHKFRLVQRGGSEVPMSQSYFEAMFWPGWEQPAGALPVGTSAAYSVYPWDTTYEGVAEDIGAVYHYMHHGERPVPWRKPRPKPAHLVGVPGPPHSPSASETATISVLFASTRVAARNDYRCTISGLNHELFSHATLEAAPSVQPARYLIDEVTIPLTRQLLSGDTDLAEAFIDRYLSELRISAAQGNSTNLDSLGLHLLIFLSRARETAPPDLRQAAVDHALSWSRQYLAGEANVLGAAPALGIASEVPAIDFRTPMPKADLWGMWALICGLATAAGGDVAALMASPGA